MTTPDDVRARFERALPTEPEPSSWGPLVRRRARVVRRRRAAAGLVAACAAVAAVLVVPTLVDDPSTAPAPTREVDTVPGLADGCPPRSTEPAYPADGVVPDGPVAVRMCRTRPVRFQAPADELTTDVDWLVDLVNDAPESEPQPSNVQRACPAFLGRSETYWFRYADGSAVAVTQNHGGCGGLFVEDPGRPRAVDLSRAFTERLLAQRAEQTAPATDVDDASCDAFSARSLLPLDDAAQFTSVVVCSTTPHDATALGSLTPAEVSAVNADFAVDLTPIPLCPPAERVRLVVRTTWGDVVELPEGCGKFQVPVADPATALGGTETWTPGPDAAAAIDRYRPPGGVIGEDEADLGRAFVRFARGLTDSPPTDTPVDVYLGGELTATIPAGESGDRSRWSTCVAEGGYAAASCPLSPLDFVAGEDAGIGYSTDEPDVLCAPEGRPLPESLDSYERLTLTPTRLMGCLDGWAVELFVDDAGQIRAANLTLSEP